MIYDYSKLKGKIVEVCGYQSVFAKKMSLSDKTVCLKLNNKINFKQDEIQKAIQILNLSDGDIVEYFFCKICSK